MAKTIKLQGDIGNQLPHCIGIICAENILKLSWLLNRNLKFHLSQAPSLIEKNYEFVVFQDETEDGKISLLKNKTDSFCYFPELKNIDYMLFLPAALDNKSIVLTLRNITEIYSTLLLDINNIKSKNKIGQFS